MLTAILTICLLAPKQDAPDKIKILGTDVPVSFPAGIEVPEGTTYIESAGWRWMVDDKGQILKRYRVDGGWADLKSMYDASRSTVPTAKYPIKVVIVENAASISVSKAGIVRSQFHTVSDEDLDTVKSSLATLKGCIEAVTARAFDVQFEVVLDSDLYFDDGTASPTEWNPVSLSSPPSQAKGQEFLRTVIAPQINDEAFDADDGVNRGPFAAVYVIHPGLPVPDGVTLVDNTPVVTLGFHTFSEIKASVSLPARLFEDWKTALGVSATHSAVIFSDSGPTVPNVVTGPFWRALVERSLRKPGSLLPAPSVSLEQPGALATFRNSTATKEGDSVPFDVLELVASSGRDSSIESVRMEGRFIKAYLSGSVDKKFFGRTDTIKPESLKPGSSIGDFVVQPSRGPGNELAWTVQFDRDEIRGRVSLAEGLLPKDSLAVMFMVRMSQSENLAIVSQNAEFLISGDAPTKEEDPAAKLHSVVVPGDNEWHEVILPGHLLGTGPIDLWLAPIAGRLTHGEFKIELTVPSYVDKVAQPLSITAHPAYELAKVNGPLNDAQKQTLIQALSSSNSTVRLTAINTLSRVTCQEAVSALSDLSRSGYASVAERTFRALEFQNTEPAWAAVRAAIEHGPFDHNRRFAAEALYRHPDPYMAASLNLMGSRSAMARQSAIRALGQIKTINSRLILSNLILNEPNPAVRLQVIQMVEPTDNKIERKILAVAVNDPSQWIRATAYTKILDSNDPSVQAEAFKAINDEAIGVRLHVLDVMRASGRASYRPALSRALEDKTPEVRAAAIRAWAGQQGSVSESEVASVREDTDPMVKAAYAELARAKGF